MNVTFRPYTLQDRETCLALFGSNCPDFFHPSERADFAAFLQDPAADGEYLLLLQEGAGGVLDVVGCGGLWVSEDGVGGLSWGMVRRDLHRQGLGTRLTQERLDRLRARPDVRRIRLDTSQHSAPFYARQGFTVTQRTPDGFAPGMDEIKMTLDLPHD